MHYQCGGSAVIALDDSIRKLMDRYCESQCLSPNGERHLKYALNAFEKWAGETLRVRDFERLNAFIRARSKTHAAESVRSQRTALVTLMRSAISMGLLEDPGAIRSAIKCEIIPRALTHAELSRAITGCKSIPYGDKIEASINVAYDSGLRKMDVLTAAWEGLDDGIIHRIQGKSRRRIGRRLRPATIALCRAIGNSRLLVGWTLADTAWRRSWEKLAVVAKLPKGVGLQMVRRSAASYVAANGGNAAAFLGHSPQSSGLAARYYLDPRICGDPPPLPPEIA